jgi:predicted membrane-bound spermidine synthase
MLVPGTGLLALRWQFAGGFIVIWNALMLLAIWFNGGWGTYHDTRAFFTLACALLGAAVVFISIVVSSSFRSWATHPSRRHKYEPTVFCFLALLCGGMGVAIVMFGLRGLS